VVHSRHCYGYIRKGAVNETNRAFRSTHNHACYKWLRKLFSMSWQSLPEYARCCALRQTNNRVVDADKRSNRDRWEMKMMNGNLHRYEIDLRSAKEGFRWEEAAFSAADAIVQATTRFEAAYFPNADPKSRTFPLFRIVSITPIPDDHPNTSLPLRDLKNCVHYDGSMS